MIALGSGLGNADFTLVVEAVGRVSYSVAKAALIMVMGKYAVRFKPDGLVFLTLSPGVVDTTATAAFLRQ